MMKSQLCLGLTCLSVGMLACGGDPELLEISSSQAALTASENTERALQGVIDAADFLASSTSIAETLSAFGGSEETCESTGAFCPDGVDCPPPETVCTSDEVSEADLEENRQAIRDDADELVRRLREEIFVEANLESETSTSATYRLGPEVLCSADDSDAPPSGSGAPAFEPELDADCVDQVDRLEPRLVLTSPREGDIDVTLLLGSERHAPLTLSLYRQSLGLRVDLAEGLAVARELGDDLEAIHELSGLLELRLVENAARDYSLELNVLEAVSAEVESDGDVLTTSLGASSPAWNVRVDGNANALSAGFDLAAFRLTGPLRAFADAFAGSEDRDVAEPSTGAAYLPPEQTPEEPAPPMERTYTGVLDLFLAGLSGTLHYTADSDVLAFEDLGFGDSTSTLEHDGNRLLALDLNAAAGRRVNLTFTPSDEGTQIDITPSFDLRLALAFHFIADQFDGIADYLLDDTLHAWFEGDSPSLEAKDEQLRVLSGTLHIESQAQPSANLSVAAGMCLQGSSDDSGSSDSGSNGAGSSSADPSSDPGASSSEESAEPERHPLLELEASSCE
jgi:hypothetical protein